MKVLAVLLEKCLHFAVIWCLPLAGAGVWNNVACGTYIQRTGHDHRSRF